MPTRYEKETPKWVYELLDEIRENHHEDLADAAFYIWFDTQKRTAGGHITLGSISKANAKTRTLAGDQYDYEVILDAEVFKNLNGAQQRHLMHWLLCHCQVTTEDEEPQFGLRDPDYPLYADEMTFNPHWRQTWDDMRNLAAQVHSGRTGVPTNDPDNPNMFGDGAPDPNVQDAEAA